ncbi:MAG: hypothetical protein NTX82_03565 [Candidatus Parcubacteria bacterium]|nr:hypothetical protein [Candidatus Parcubacteria bacterium]
MKKILIGVLITCALIIILIAAAGIYKFNFTNDDIHIACDTMAKLCPDGSAVGRTGPNCEFSPCPNSVQPVCTQEAKLCGDGTSVSRVGPNCEFSDCPHEPGDLAVSCQSNNGNWLNDYQECENISESWCSQLAGFFNGCESACRHDPQAKVCTMQCVPVCKFNSGLSESDARLIAERTCIKGGEALSSGTYNEITKTWWFDANLNATKEGCNPACVVNEATKTAEINWRCTGLIVPKE